MHNILVARFTRTHYDEDTATRERVDEIITHLKDLALDVGLDPEANVQLNVNQDDVRVGVSEVMDAYLREAPGEWRHY